MSSTDPSTSTSQSNFASIFNAALESYKRKTKKDLSSHPLLPKLESCNSPDDICTVLRNEIPKSSESENSDNGLIKLVMPTVNILLALSSTIGSAVGIVSIRIFLVKNFFSYIHFQAHPPANVVVTGISVLLTVGIVHVSLPQPIFTPVPPRRRKMIAPAGTNSSTSSIALKISFTGLRHISASNRL
jgi:hypothetical protein